MMAYDVEDGQNCTGADCSVSDEERVAWAHDHGCVSFLVDDVPDPQATARGRNEVLHGMFTDLQGTSHRAILKYYVGEKAKEHQEAEASALERVNERGVGPKLYVGLAPTAHVKIKPMPERKPLSRIDAEQMPHLIIEDVGVNLGSVLKGVAKNGTARIPRFDRANAEELEIILPDDDDQCWDTFTRKILFDLAWQLDALLNKLDIHLCHGDIKLQNICVAAWGPDPADVRATLIDFETADRSGLAGGTRGVTESYRRLLNKCEPGTPAYDLGCLALVCQQLSTPKTPLDSTTHVTFQNLETASCFTYIEHDGQIIPQSNLSALPALVQSCAEALGLTDAETSLQRFTSQQTRSAARKLLDNRSWVDAKDLYRFARVHFAPIQPDTPRTQPHATAHIVLAASNDQMTTCQEVARFIHNIMPTYHNQGTDLILNEAQSCRTSDELEHLVQEADHVIVLTSNTAELPHHFERMVQANIKRLPIAVFTPLDNKMSATPLNASPSGKGGGIPIYPYNNPNDINFYLVMRLGRLAIAGDNIASIGPEEIDVTKLLLYTSSIAQAEEEAKQKIDEVNQAALKRFENPDDQQAEHEYLEALSAQKEAFERQSNQRKRALEAIRQLVSAFADTDFSTNNLAEESYSAIAAGKPELVSTLLTSEALRHSMKDACDALDAYRSNELLVRTTRHDATEKAASYVQSNIMLALSYRLQRYTKERADAYKKALRRAARFEFEQQKLGTYLPTDACELYALYLEREEQQHDAAFDYFNHARNAYIALRSNNPAVYERKICRVTLSIGMLEANQCTARRDGKQRHVFISDINTFFNVLVNRLGRLTPDAQADNACQGSQAEPFDLTEMRARAYVTWGSAVALTDSERAYQHFVTGIELRRSKLDTPDAHIKLAHKLNTAGRILLNTSRIEDAITFLQEAETYFAHEPGRDDLLRSYRYNQVGLVIAYRKRGDTERAALHQLSALQLTHRLVQMGSIRETYLTRTLIETIKLLQKLGNIPTPCGNPGASSVPVNQAICILLDELNRRAFLEHSPKLKQEANKLANQMRDDAGEPIFRAFHQITYPLKRNFKNALFVAERTARSFLKASFSPSVPCDGYECEHYALVLVDILHLQADQLDKDDHYGSNGQRISKTARLQQQRTLHYDALAVLRLTQEYLEKEGYTPLVRLEESKQGSVLKTKYAPASRLLIAAAYELHGIATIEYKLRQDEDRITSLEQSTRIFEHLYEDNPISFGHAYAATLRQQADVLSKRRDKQTNDTSEQDKNERQADVPAEKKDKHQALKLLKRACEIEREALSNNRTSEQSLANMIVDLGNVESICKEGLADAPRHLFEGTQMLRDLADVNPTQYGCNFAHACAACAEHLPTLARKVDDPSLLDKAIDYGEQAVQLLLTMEKTQQGDRREILSTRAYTRDMLANCLLQSSPLENLQDAIRMHKAAIRDTQEWANFVRQKHEALRELISPLASLALQQHKLAELFIKHASELGNDVYSEAITIKKGELKAYADILKHADALQKGEINRRTKSYLNALNQLANIILKDVEQSAEQQNQEARARRFLSARNKITDTFHNAQKLFVKLKVPNKDGLSKQIEKSLEKHLGELAELEHPESHEGQDDGTADSFEENRDF